MIDDGSLFEPPSQNELARRADDLMRRAHLVVRHRWNEYRQLCPCGQVLGVALALHDDAELQRCGETTSSALNRWAYHLWGITDGRADTDAGLPRSRAWFESVRAGMDRPLTQQPHATR